MWLAPLLVIALAAAVVWLVGQARLAGRFDDRGASRRAIEVLHASVATVPASSFDARLRIVRR